MPARRTRFRSWAVNALLTVGSLVVGLLLAEGGLRLFHYKPQISSGWMIRERDLTLDDDVLIVGPPVTDENFAEPYRARGAAKLVVTIGDSFSDGYPVERERSYPAVLERFLHERGFDARVLNVGMGDTGPDQQLKLFTKFVLPRLKPDIVIWQFYPNDTYDNTTKPLFDISSADTLVPIDPRQGWLYRRQRFYRAIPLPQSVKRKSYLVNLLLRTYEKDLEAQVPKGVDPFPWSRHKIELEIRQMNALAAERGFTVYYVLLAPQADYIPALPTGTQGAYELSEYAELLPILARQPTLIDGRFSAASPEIFCDESRDRSPLGTRHFNERGYALFARAVADRILDGPPPIHVAFGTPAARRWMGSGWSHDESFRGQPFVWSEGPQSTLDVPLPSGHDVQMNFDCAPLRAPGAAQRIRVSINGVDLPEVTLAPERRSYRITLPKTALRDSTSSISLRYQWTRSPREVDPASTDVRQLGVAWYSLDLQSGS